MYIQNKRGVSVIIGYVLLIAVVVAISVVVYQWLKTYVPSDTLSCPDGVSVSIYNYSYNCGKNGQYTLNFTLENTGTFSIAGYFIHTTTTNSQIAAIDLSAYYTGPESRGNGIIFAPVVVNGASDPNSFKPGPEYSKGPGENKFNIASLSSPGSLVRIEITPIRYEEYQGNSVPASCVNSKIVVPIECTST